MSSKSSKSKSTSSSGKPRTPSSRPDTPSGSQEVSKEGSSDSDNAPIGKMMHHPVKPSGQPAHRLSLIPSETDSPLQQARSAHENDRSATKRTSDDDAATSAPKRTHPAIATFTPVRTGLDSAFGVPSPFPGAPVDHSVDAYAGDVVAHPHFSVSKDAIASALTGRDDQSNSTEAEVVARGQQEPLPTARSYVPPTLEDTMGLDVAHRPPLLAIEPRFGFFDKRNPLGSLEVSDKIREMCNPTDECIYCAITADNIPGGEIVLMLPRDDQVLLTYYNHYTTNGNAILVFMPPVLSPHARLGLVNIDGRAFERVYYFGTVFPQLVPRDDASNCAFINVDPSGLTNMFGIEQCVDVNGIKALALCGSTYIHAFDDAPHLSIAESIFANLESIAVLPNMVGKTTKDRPCSAVPAVECILNNVSTRPILVKLPKSRDESLVRMAARHLNYHLLANTAQPVLLASTPGQLYDILNVAFNLIERRDVPKTLRPYLKLVQHPVTLGEINMDAPDFNKQGIYKFIETLWADPNIKSN